VSLQTSAADVARALTAARALVVTAGAGMGVDSGLPDFRGPEGFWSAYPPYRRLGLTFEEAANPEHFEGDPAFGWGFYGHRTNLYRATVPHAGFGLLRGWAARLGLEPFVVTSNVDGQFQKAGFDEERIVEIHGSIHHLQCTGPCSDDIWENREAIPVDEATMRAGRVPTCPRCHAPSRPNILMFGDWSWLPDRTRIQEQQFDNFLARNSGRRIAVIEMGAGSAIPTIRATSERIGWSLAKATVIRINPREPRIDPPHLSLPCGAVEGLEGIRRELEKL